MFTVIPRSRILHPLPRRAGPPPHPPAQMNPEKHTDARAFMQIHPHLGKKEKTKNLQPKGADELGKWLTSHPSATEREAA